VRRERADRDGWRRWRRHAKRRSECIQNARGKRRPTMRAVMMHFGESLVAIGAMNVDGHTHFCEKTPTTQSRSTT
jgi:hypothetical protein